ncbi:MAG: matrixin family metalloprotease [Pseudomonadota bacterium]
MFAFLNTKWGDPTLGTSPDEAINWSADLSGLDTTPGASTADLESALESAFDRWEDAAAIEFEEGGSTIEVDIGFAPIVNDPGSPNVIVAFAEWTPATGSLDSAEITFNSNVEWAPTGDGGFDFAAVALHEIGHIIGLAHPSDADEFPDEIMNIVVRADDLGDGDITAAQTLYGRDPGDDEEPDLATTDVSDSPTLTASDSGGGGGGAGILAGLFALIVGIFTGGLAPALAFAAASASNEDDDELEPDKSDDGLVHHGAGCNCGACMLAHGHSHEVTLESGTIEVSHVTYAELPTVEFDYDSMEQDDPDEDVDDDFFIA